MVSKVGGGLWEREREREVQGGYSEREEKGVKL